MKLGATITSERGKSITKTGNINIKIDLLDENGNQKYFIMYTDTLLHVYEIVNKQGGGKLILTKENGNLKHGRESCKNHGTQFMERHKLDGHYICRACVVESIK